MNEQLNGITKKVDLLESKFDEFFKTINGLEFPATFVENLKHYQNTKRLYHTQLKNNESDERLLGTAKNLAIFGQAIKHSLNDSSTLDNAALSLMQEISVLSNTIRSEIESRPVMYDMNYNIVEPQNKNTNNNSNTNEIVNIRQLLQEVQILKEDHEKHDQRHKKLLSENQRKLEEIESKSIKLEEIITTRIDKIDKLYSAGVDELETKKKEVNKLLSIISGNTIAGNFEQSAAEEKKTANWLRYASIACMSVIVLIIGFSFYETTTSNFKWENAIFRIVLTFLLSVPSAYLARESAKHRQQQYNHLQTSLDLKAINPYLASLPSAEQHKIKTDIAGRIFAAKDFTHVGKDPYPLNTQEVVMELIKKLDFKQTTSKT